MGRSVQVAVGAQAFGDLGDAVVAVLGQLCAVAAGGHADQKRRQRRGGTGGAVGDVAGQVEEIGDDGLEALVVDVEDLAGLEQPLVGVLSRVGSFTLGSFLFSLAAGRGAAASARPTLGPCPSRRAVRPR